MVKKTNNQGTPTTTLILSALLGVGVVTVAVIAPNALGPFLQIAGISRPKYRGVPAALYGLRKAGYITFERNGHDVAIRLTAKGKRRALAKQLVVPHAVPKKWDGRWRVVIFDVPKDRRVMRDAFRGLLKRYGFRSLQKSVWIYPHECADAIRGLQTFFEVDDHSIRLLTCSSIGNDAAYRKVFQLA